MKASSVRGGGRFEIPFASLVPYLIPFVLAGAALLVNAPGVWLVLLTDGVWPVVVLSAAAGLGAWPARWLQSADWTAGQEFSLALALGLGILGTATLGLGVSGALSFPSGVGLLIVGGLVGLGRLAGLARRASTADEGHADPDGRDDASSDRAAPDGRLCRHGTRTRHGTQTRHVALAILALLPLCVPLYVLAFGACLPPGVLWPEEANGYDVLEYHLQVPREWFERGRIEFLPHNVYASFPQQTEIFYLLLMHLCRDPHAAAIPSQLLHAGLGVMAVFAIGAWLPAGWPRILGVALASTTPWIAYLGCLAYVENTLLFFAAVAAGIVLTWYRAGGVATRRAALAAGLCAGLAGACKYTGLVFVAAGLLVAMLLTMRPADHSRLRRRFFGPLVAIYLLGVMLGVAPWLMRNAVFTGNPVYPFAYEVFGGRGWSVDQAEQWKEGHSFRGTVNRFFSAADELFRGRPDPAQPFPIALNQFGLLPTASLLALLGFLYFKVPDSIRRETLFVGLWTVAIFIAWSTLTHVPGRFAAVLIIPLSSVLALTVGRPQASEYESQLKRAMFETPLRLALYALLALTLAAGLAVLLSAHSAARSSWERRVGLSMAELLGRTDALLENQPLNVLLPKGASVWLVGDAAVFYVNRRVQYHTVFNRDPWIEFAKTADAGAAVGWLRQQGVTHVVFNWGEIERLRKTYGFSERVTREWVTSLQGAGLEAVVVSSEMSAALRGVEVLAVGR